MRGAVPLLGVPVNCGTGTEAVDGKMQTKINTTTMSKNFSVDFNFTHPLLSINWFL
jgi:hypothetical protein